MSVHGNALQLSSIAGSDTAATAHLWARSIRRAGHVPASHADVQVLLEGLLLTLQAIATTEPFRPADARPVGMRLAQPPFTGTRILSHTIAALTAAQQNSRSERWAAVIGEVAEAYAEAVQERALIQQEEILQAAVLVHDQQVAALQDQLRHQATHDPLTGLANRTLLHTVCAQLAAGSSAPLNVLVVDLDRLKAVNDQYGHPAGDEMLVATAQRLSSILLDGDIVARYGGDEFVIATCGFATPWEPAERVIDALRIPFELSVGQLEMTASIGVAQVPVGRRVDVHALIKDADSAMYSVKSTGGNGYRVFGCKPADAVHRI
ncbi:GGDEF domain-containing protein [Antrihabitans cavernicola]|nr:GGDEF domain-containing protein [Spelaeibacter cavernicola]